MSTRVETDPVCLGQRLQSGVTALTTVLMGLMKVFAVSASCYGNPIVPLSVL